MPTILGSVRRRLRERLEEPGVAPVPGVTNVLDGLSAQRAGFDAVFITGAGVANSHFGYPDIGLITLSEIASVSRRIISALDVPVIVDADDGYGNHLNVTRTVGDLEAIGAAAIVLEDQVAPKKCGHFSGKRVVAPRVMVEKLIAARTARTDPELVLIARTDAVAIEGIEAAIARARLYAEAGADAIFVEAPTSAADMARVPKEVPLPCVVNVVEGGLTPLLSLDQLAEQGYKVALYANLALRVSSNAVNRAFDSLRATGSSEASIQQMLSWEARQSAVGLSRWEQLDEEIATEARRFLETNGVSPGGGDDD